MQKINLDIEDLYPKRTREEVLSLQLIVSEEIDREDYEEIIESDLNPSLKIRLITSLCDYKVVYTYKVKDNFRMKIYNSFKDMKQDFNYEHNFTKFIEGVKK